MKIKSLFLLTVLSLSVAILPGCATAGKETAADKVARVERLSYAAASIGTQAALLANPEYRPEFELAYTSLDTLVTSGSVNGVVLRNILAGLPVKELKSPEAQLAISSATVLFDALAGTSVQLTNNVYVVSAATGIRDGMKVALGK